MEWLYLRQGRGKCRTLGNTIVDFSDTNESTTLLSMFTYSLLITYLILTYLLTYLLTYSLTHSLTYLLTYLLTHSMEQSPFWEANRFSASQEIPRILWNPKVHYRIHRCPPPVSILRQLDLTSWRYILLLFPIYRWVSQVVIFSQVSPPKPCICLSTLPYALHSPPISFFSTICVYLSNIKNTYIVELCICWC